MPRSKKEVERALCAKGFRLLDSHHHFFVYYTLDGRKSAVRTKTSHSRKMKDISDAILSQMAKQCRLSSGEFLDLIDCPLTQNGFETRLKDKGQL